MIFREPLQFSWTRDKWLRIGGTAMWLVFDIETIPDAQAGRRLLGMDPGFSEQAVRQAMLQARGQETDGHSTFLKPAFHQVVAIAGALIDDEGQLRRLKPLGRSDDSEAVLVREFFRIIDDVRPRLVGWNSSGFDLPTLIYRAIRHRVVAAGFYRAGEPYHGYRKRFDEEMHLDLMDLLSGYGASARLTLHEMAMVLNIPGKLDIAGEDVLALYEAEQHERIREYCARDVLTTSLIFGHYAYHRGWWKDSMWKTFLESVERFLRDDEAGHWASYRQATTTPPFGGA